MTAPTTPRNRIPRFRHSVPAAPAASTAPRRVASARILLGALAILLSATGCQLRGVVDIGLKSDGSGTVTVRVGLDAQAVERVGDLKTIRTADIAAGGWTLEPINTQPDADGWVWIVAAKPFSDRASLNAVLGELSNDQKLFSDFKVEVLDGFAETTYTLTGTIDATGGMEQFTDAQATALLDGLPLGRTPEELAADLGEGQPLPEISLNVTMPGTAIKPPANASKGVTGNVRTFTTVIGAPEPLNVSVTSTITETRPRQVLIAGAVLIGLAAVSTIVIWRRGRKLARLRRNASIG